MTKYIVDLAYLLILIITVAIYTKRGFVESVFKHGRRLFAGIIAYAFGPAVSAVVYDNFMFNRIYYWVWDKMQVILHAAEEYLDVGSLIDGLPFAVKQFINPEEIKSIYGETMANIDKSAQSFAETVSSPLANVLSNMIAYVLVFLVALLVLFVFGKLLDLIVNLPILRTINRILGFLTGAGAAFLLLAAVTYVISFIIGLFGDVLSLQSLTEVSDFYNFFHELQFFNLH